MIQKIVGGIAERLLEEFGKDITVYSEEVCQNFKEPCFVIKLVSSLCQKGIGGRRKFVNRFLIQYFPKPETKNFDMSVVSDRMFDCLEFIDAGRVIRGIDMKADKGSAIILNGISSNYENGDGILNFYVNYDFHEVSVDEEPFMEKLKTVPQKN